LFPKTWLHSLAEAPIQKQRHAGLFFRLGS
jgi:hypothetical protein